MAEIHYLYVMASVENDVPVSPCKIGVTANVTSRLSGVQTGNPKKLELISVIPIPTKALAHAIEHLMHAHFDEFRLHGEWFSIGPVDAAIGLCTLARDAFVEIIPDEKQAYDALENLGIVAEISRCFKFIEHCQKSGKFLETRFDKNRSLN